ncbi:PKD domain-containing protein [Methanogenium sp. MK-MG]|uniref:PKD domain-containing protein n=1 Tax=Methanogenium sp. MK-MG TaxID=2599926 RepID=UPI0013EAE28E|nr:PKD domain-containing protein [Methanogenium sp. MK-MG]KAF1078663.1 hypothetical protein MKMG_00416 [Methanogenium sp. MK-MG]
MKKSTLPFLQRILNLPEGIPSGLLITLVAVLVIFACAVPAVSADTPLTVSFSFSPASPDVGESVSFSGTSTWSNITNWAWNFGDGGSSASQNPTHTYDAAGTYSVYLTASNAAGTATSSPQSVTVNAAANPPVASFTFSPASPVVGQAVSFTDASTGDGITSWSWDFGDGQGNTLQNPSHAYASAGTYTVSLTVTNAAGTSSPYTRSVTVTAENPPVASFSFSPASPAVGQAVSFTDASTGGGITSWNWNFGDGQSSTLQNPSHAYTSANTYTVSLTVTNAAGTSTPYTRSVTVTAASNVPVASFNTDLKTGDAPLTVKFTDTSQAFNGASIATRKWDFDDGSGIITEQNPEHTFTSVKSYTVRLTVTDDAGLSSSTTEIITAENPLEAKFTWNPTNPDADEKVTFTDQSDGYPDEWIWDFGDNTGYVGKNPPDHSFTKDDEYDVKLTIKKDGLPSVSVIKEITVGEGTTTFTGDNPVADFTWSPTSPVVGQVISFSDISTGDDIDRWKWHFDDRMDFSGNRLSTLENPKHTYENADSYDVTLTVWNSGGGKDHILKTVTVGTVRLNARFNAYPSSGTAPLAVRFVDASTGADIDSWYWDFGNGQTYTGKSPSNVVYSSPGTYTASLEVRDGSKTDEYTARITVSPQATATAVQTAVPTATPAPAKEVGFIGGEYRKMAGLYNEYISIIFGFLGIHDEPDFLIIAVKDSQT